ncbi:MAG: tRNA lysidine(34) synthetase TilS [Pseudomonadota bacterium]|nr:tRNA lysidine(34) synthetase TilS [Pseudomonadota bacterium]
MSFSAGSLRTLLEAHAPAAATGFVVALSGGADSAGLLTALCQPGSRPFRDLPVRALHIDHGLQPAAADFRRTCESLCASLCIPLSIVAVCVDPHSGESIEAAARVARYQAFARSLRPGECLMTAHHAQDQAETVLLQVLRGAGLKGLSAMPLCRAYAGGWHLRPLLTVARRELREFCEQAGIRVSHDPMNRDVRFDRAYLRERLWPLIEERWPAAAITVSRTALHVVDAQALLDRCAALSLKDLRDGAALSVTGLRALPAPQRRNAVRHWLCAAGVAPPSAARMGEALRQILEAQEDHLPAVVWGSHALRRYRGRLHLTEAEPPSLGEKPREWSVAAGLSLDLGRGLGTLRWSMQSGGLDPALLPSTLSVRQRRGGETLKVQRRGRTQTLQHLCQAAGVFPWMRDALPLVYAGAELIAVGDLWHNARWCVPAPARGFACVWTDAPILT